MWQIISKGIQCSHKIFLLQIVWSVLYLSCEVSSEAFFVTSLLRELTGFGTSGDHGPGPRPVRQHFGRVYPGIALNF